MHPFLKPLAALAALLAAGAAQAQDGSGVCRVAPIAADNPAINTAAPFGNAANHGATWASPMTLQQALGTAGCQQIHLRQGVYKPVVPADAAAVTEAERQTRFAITRPLQLLGGYTGNAAQPGERVLRARNTVLSGDIGGNDTDANASDGITEGLHKSGYDNSYHVVSIGGLAASVGGPYTADASDAGYTLIEGLTITGGYAAKSGGANHPDYSGGGLFCNCAGAGAVCSPRIRHVYFTGNAAGRGGALYLQADDGTSSPVISHTTFYGNRPVPAAMAVPSTAWSTGAATPAPRSATPPSTTTWQAAAARSTAGPTATSTTAAPPPSSAPRSSTLPSPATPPPPAPAAHCSLPSPQVTAARASSPRPRSAHRPSRPASCGETRRTPATPTTSSSTQRRG
jgi:hypothetical protein